ncbi:acyl carrier protein [Actinoplanes missouriensis]|uniref:acyl carrier protein n=1 Tax=Actinoplanes missouriensis TaxID=1866 RepID=UPI003400BCA8
MQPRTVDDVPTVIAEEMGRVLSGEPLDLHRDFFLAGGDSVRAVELITRLGERFSDGTEEDSARLCSALLLAVFEDATPEALAVVVREHL